MIKFRFILVSVILIGAPGALLTASAANASAATTSWCDHTHEYFNSQYSLSLPAWTDGVHGGYDCYMDRQHGPKDVVKLLQSTLNICYHTDLAVDGIYGGLTESTVSAVQRIENISPDGKYGPVTGRKIYWPLRRSSDDRFLRCWKR